MNLMPVSYIAIESSCGRFELSDLFHDEKHDLYQTPMLQVRDKDGKELDLWDNDEWLLKLFLSLEQDFRGPHYREFMADCDKYNWNFAEVSKILLDIFKEAKRLKMFKL